MRYRRLGYRHTFMVGAPRARQLGDLWGLAGPGVVVAQPRWRPPADVYETVSSITVIVELPGVDQDELEVLLFEDALVVQGDRHLPPIDTVGRYQAAEIRQGPFRYEARLSASIDADRVDATYEQGLLTITLVKRRADDRSGGARRDS